MKKNVLTLCVLVLVTTAMTAQDQGRRGLLFQVGLGPSEISYGSDTDTYLQNVADQEGVDRVQINLGVSLGLAVTQQTYITFGIEGLGDRFDHEYGYVSFSEQFNTVLYTVGFKHYPFTKGLVLSGRVGSGILGYSYNDEKSSWDIDAFGGSLGAGFDFGLNRMTGFSLEVGVDSKYVILQDDNWPDPITAVGL